MQKGQIETNGRVKVEEERIFWYSYLNLPDHLRPESLTEIFLTFTHIDEAFVDEIKIIIPALPKIFSNLQNITVYYDDENEFGKQFKTNCWNAMKDVRAESKESIDITLFPLLFECETEDELFISYTVDPDYEVSDEEKENQLNNTEDGSTGKEKLTDSDWNKYNFTYNPDLSNALVVKSEEKEEREYPYSSFLTKVKHLLFNN